MRWSHLYLIRRKNIRIFLKGSYSALELNIGKCSAGYEFILHLWCNDCYLKWSVNYYNFPKGIARKVRGGRLGHRGVRNWGEGYYL